MRYSRRSYRPGVVAVFCLLITGFCWAQPNVAEGSDYPMAFERMGVREGLSVNNVTDILQDSRGYVWIATESGLNRYDGYDVQVYSSAQAGRHGLRNDYIWELAEDKDGNIWLATNEAGVLRWSRETDQFTSFLAVAGTDRLDARRRSRALLIDRDGRLWVGTTGAGVYVLDAHGRLLTEYVKDATSARGLSSNYVVGLMQDQAGAIWVATSDGGLDRIAADGATVVRRGAGIATGVPSNSISSLIQTSTGEVWVGTADAGVVRLHEDGDGFQRIEGSDDGRGRQVYDLLEDRLGQIWVATAAGLHLYDLAGNLLRAVRHDPADPLSLSNDIALTLYQDRSGIIWVGTLGGGVSRWNPRSLSLGPRTPRWLGGAHVNAFADLQGGTILVGTIGSGLLHLGPQGERLAALPLPAHAAEIGDQRVMSLLVDGQGRLWIGTQKHGLYMHDPQSGSVRNFSGPASDRPGELAASGIMSLHEAPDGRVWVGLFNGGVAAIDGRTLQVDEVPLERSAPGLAKLRATALAMDANAQLWIGTEGDGLLRYNPAVGSLEHFLHEPEREGSLPVNTVYGLSIDSRGDIWVATAGGGLAHLRDAARASSSSNFRVLSLSDGLSSNVVYGVLEDGAGMMWVSTARGIVRIEPDRMTARSYHQEHGLFGEEFNFGAYHRLRDGRLIFGGTGGFNLFDPAEVVDVSVPPLLQLTALEPTDPSSARQEEDGLHLSHRMPSLSFEFAVLDFAAPDKNRYSYRLQGLEAGWSPESTRRRVSYTNLDAGQYVFRVRGANSDGVWAEQELAIPFRVDPAPWATWWAYTLYVLAGIAALGLFLRWNFRATARRARFNQLAFYDPVTGLPNRYLFQDRAQAVLERSQSRQESLALICVRVVVGRQVSDTLSADALDDVMRTLVARFVRIVHGGDTDVGRRDLARIDSDWFAVYIADRAAEAVAVRLGERFLRAITEPVYFRSWRLPLAVHVGIASCPKHAGDLRSLMKYAKTAGNSAEQEHVSSIRLYETKMTTRAASRVSLESQLRTAVDEDALELYFQPQYNVAGEVVGAEALLRWHDPERGWVSPSEFVPLAEESDLILAIDAWVAEAVCQFLVRWKQSDVPRVPLSINFSAFDLDQDTSVEFLLRACARHDVAPRELTVELTESSVLRDTPRVHASLQRLKAAGFRIALDDFGTGFSSLTHLKTFSIDAIKIDREFVEGVDENDGQLSICKAITALAGSLGLRVIAEGVETLGQWRALQSVGCTEMQGFLMSPAIPEDEFLNLLQRIAESPGGGVPIRA